MKLKYLVLALAGALALNVSAQETKVGNEPARKVSFMRDKAGDHWFVTLQGGMGSQFLCENENKAYDLDKIKQSYSLSIGQFHSPYFATRLQFAGAQAPTFWGNKGENHYDTSFVGAHFDFMFDVVNYFASYKENRVFHLMPFVGFGGVYKFNNKFENPNIAASVNAGLQMAFRLCKRADFVIEAKGNYNHLSIALKDQKTEWNPEAYNGLYGAATAGFRFYLGRKEFTEVVPMDYDLINDLNNQINSLRAENAELSKRPVECPEYAPVQPKVENVVVAVLDKTVLFRFNSSRVDRSQDFTMHQIVEFMNKYPEAKIVAVGTADMVGGRGNYNLKLSERRVKAVVKALIEKHGISEDRISIEWEGASDKHATRAWNRAVTVRSK